MFAKPQIALPAAGMENLLQDGEEPREEGDSDQGKLPGALLTGYYWLLSKATVSLQILYKRPM